jgi:hypothetical protein
LDIDGELCTYFVDRQKAYDRVKWTMHILKETGIDLRERRLNMDKSVKLKLDQEKRRSIKIGIRVQEGYCMSLNPAGAMDVCLLFVLGIVK